MSDSLENLQQALTLWTNIAHKLWEAKSTLLPKNSDHGHGEDGDSPIFSKEILAVYDGLDALYIEAEAKKREILACIASIQGV
ncbi:hypothetical protein Dform_00508 [Dehalogenimonas formicexedens]|uniref:Uncharacterized protein n=1 Tax=Dehalogenimonas formicexedens TaxID=1839801 RepID=A0A1P8F5W2_9CHLR|nr:hypothetical protein [Dehalogenimonas formicexedens]APV43863.1 hypothetical protein Dform_00508 [Dehalogenimonas formicexedens]